jgi:hypothetical protein
VVAVAPVEAILPPLPRQDLTRLKMTFTGKREKRKEKKNVKKTDYTQRQDYISTTTSDKCYILRGFSWRPYMLKNYASSLPSPLLMVHLTARITGEMPPCPVVFGG